MALLVCLCASFINLHLTLRCWRTNLEIIILKLPMARIEPATSLSNPSALLRQGAHKMSESIK